jgi:hypothetical protein
MLQLNSLLTPSRFEPYEALCSKDDPGLPENILYMVVEFYCENSDCDCQSLVADVMALNENKGIIPEILAQISYDWSSKATRCYPELTEHSPKTPLALSLLAAYKNLIHTDRYQARIRDQYVRVKKLASERELALERDFKKNPLEKIKFIKQIGRNDPCPCGSGKKYKKCCLE